MVFELTALKNEESSVCEIECNRSACPGIAWIESGARGQKHRQLVPFARRGRAAPRSYLIADYLLTQLGHSHVLT